MQTELRRTAPDDPAALDFARALREEVEARGADNAEARPRKPLTEAVMADIETLVAYAGDRPVGTAALRPYGHGIAEIKRMYVAPPFRGAGVAKQLLDALEDVRVEGIPGDSGLQRQSEVESLVREDPRA